MVYFVYILRCRDGTLYTGITTDVKRRLSEHRLGHGGAYTRSHGALKMLYTRTVRGRSGASKHEAAIKRLTRRQKLALIRSVATQSAS
jgi:putative endonuclease